MVEVAEIDERTEVDLVDIEDARIAVRIIVVDEIGVAVGEREIIAARGRILADEARRIGIERRVVIDLVEQAEVKMPVREKLELENGPVVVRRCPRIWNPSFGSVSTIVYSRRWPCDFRPTVSRASSFEPSVVKANVPWLNASTASAPTFTRPERSPDTVAGPGRLSPGLPVKEPSPLPSFGLVPCERSVSISFSSTKTFSCAPLITIGVSSMTPTSNLPAGRTNWLFAASWPPTAMERSRSRVSSKIPCWCSGFVEELSWLCSG